MADEFDQYKAAPQVDEFAQYKEGSTVSPIAPPSLANAPGNPASQPMSKVQPLTGASTAMTPQQDREQAMSPINALTDMAKGSAQSLYNISAPGILSSLSQKFPVLNKFKLPAGAPLKQLPGQMVTAFALSGEMGNPDIATAGRAIAAPTTPEAIAAARYQAVKLGQDVPLPNITPTKAAVVDPYRNQILPPMTKGVSGNVEAHAYDPATQQMITHFKSGDIYKYEGVPPKVYDQFVKADSQGSFHYNNIRGRYATEKIGKVAPTRTRGAQVSSALSQASQ